MANFTAVSLAIASTIIASVGMVLFKLAGKKKKLFLNPYFIGGGLLFFLGTLLMVVALRMEGLSTLFPITSLTYIWVMILSKLWLKEKINRWKIISVAFIALGIVLVTLKS